jgi:hypothetical protein
MRAQFWRGSVFFLLLLTASLASFAQVDTARLQGTVTDPQGAAAVGATVLITSVETGRANSTTTNDLGFYSASALPPGRYRIEVTQPGCKKISRELELQIDPGWRCRLPPRCWRCHANRDCRSRFASHQSG